jgi:hypothetical protein
MLAGQRQKDGFSDQSEGSILWNMVLAGRRQKDDFSGGAKAR